MRADYTVVTGDCRAAWALMADASFDAVITDIPYGGHVSSKDRGPNAYRSLDKGAADVATVPMPVIVRECARLARGWVYLWCDWRQVSPLMRLMERAGMSVRMGAWLKPSWSPMNGHLIWSTAMEVCAIGRKSGAPFFRQAEPPIWRGPIESSIDWHPTPKPEWLMRELVTASVPEGGSVLDPFMGSGSVGVACMMENRHFTGIELNPDWADRARKRIANVNLDLFHGVPA